MTNHRLGFDTVTDITVRGEPGFTRTLEGQYRYLSAVWHENGITYTVGSSGLSRSELLDLDGRMHPATQAGWDAMVAAAPIPEVMEEESPTTTVIEE